MDKYKIAGIFSLAAIIAGIAIAIYLYIYNFKNLSETELLFWTPFWFFPIILGYYGVVATGTLRQKSSKKLETVSKPVFEILKERLGTGMLPLLFLLHLPFLIVRSKSILLTALVGAIVWGIALHIFLRYIFPYL